MNKKDTRNSTVGWLIWSIAGLFYLYEFIHRVSHNLMVSELQHHFSIDSASLGNLSACYYYSYAICQIPAGLILDRCSTKKVLFIACLLITICSVIFANTNNLLIAQLCRICIGIGSSFSFIACLKIGVAWFPSSRMPLIIGLTNFLGVSGAIFGGRPLATSIVNIGWQTTMLHIAIYGFILCVLILLVIKDQKTNTSLSINIKQDLKHSTASTNIWLLAIIGGLMVAPIASYAELWGVAYLIDTYDMSKPYAAQIISSTFIGIGIGGPIIGWATEKYNKYILLFLGCLLANIALGCIFYLPHMHKYTLLILHVLFGFGTSAMLICFACAIVQQKPICINTTVGFLNTIIMLLGVLFQPITGLLLDLFINMQNKYTLALNPLLVCQLAALILTLYLCYKMLIKNSGCSHDRIA